MMRRIFVMALVMTLASCGQPSGTTDAAKVSSDVTPPSAASAGDPCTLIADPAEVFGRPVTANKAMMPNKTNTCEWRGADGSFCGSLVVFGPGWNEVENIPLNYEGMVTSLGAFGQTKEIAGLGEEARGVDGGILGAQVAFRKNNVAALVASACASDSLTKMALAERAAAAVAEKL